LRDLFNNYQDFQSYQEAMPSLLDRHRRLDGLARGVQYRQLEAGWPGEPPQRALLMDPRGTYVTGSSSEALSEPLFDSPSFDKAMPETKPEQEPSPVDEVDEAVFRPEGVVRSPDDKGAGQNKVCKSGRRGARLARREEGEYCGIFNR